LLRNVTQGLAHKIRGVFTGKTHLTTVPIELAKHAEFNDSTVGEMGRGRFVTVIALNMYSSTKEETDNG
jgi:hypothetical protein